TAQGKSRGYPRQRDSSPEEAKENAPSPVRKTPASPAYPLSSQPASKNPLLHPFGMPIPPRLVHLTYRIRLTKEPLESFHAQKPKLSPTSARFGPHSRGSVYPGAAVFPARAIPAAGRPEPLRDSQGQRQRRPAILQRQRQARRPHPQPH